ncbi:MULTISPECIES: ABC transporter ATP-binding protein [unclassified Exiguobacterium]|uniref:ABC transporter ATP-binding protein n=1 Tax=unclassified Exiguobacterium TaxID=2644629 RepID=UPI001BE89581|nr:MULTISPECIES: ABC transporter ATP-binding protein [unclassified Exiguobacterium]
MNSFISIKELIHTFNNLGHDETVIKQLNCTFSKNEITAIVGPSGSGKSTLLSLIGSLEKPTSGTLEFDSVILNDLNNTQLSDFRFKEIGFVFQQFHLLPSLSVFENVMVPFLTKKVDFNKEERVKEVIQQVGLETKSHVLPSQLSGGQQQRIAIARAIVNRPNWILADEPTGNLDSTNSELIFDLLVDLHETQQCGLIFVTHDLDLARRANRIIHMQDGRIVEDQKGERVC